MKPREVLIAHLVDVSCARAQGSLAALPGEVSRSQMSNLGTYPRPLVRSAWIAKPASTTRLAIKTVRSVSARKPTTGLS